MIRTSKQLFPTLTLAAVLALAGCSGSDKEPAPAPAVPAPASPEAAPGRAAALPDFTGLMKSVGPAVVNVVTTRSAAGAPGMAGGVPGDPLFEFFRRFIPDLPPPGRAEPEARGLGSGFVISQDGLILTNAHVVADASAVTIRLADGKKEFPGKVIGADARSDVALVKINATGLPVAKIGKAESVQPGQWVVAIGSPFGFTNTITAGIVSATNRELPNESIMPFIQTDVAVNPGNSGGPLINLAGEVVGINSMIYSGTGGYMGVSFAIPIEMAMDVAKQLQEKGKVSRGRLGIAIQPVTAELARAFRLKGTDGVLVSGVDPGGPADKAGLKSGDVILEYDGQPITDPAQLPRLVARSQPGTTARLGIWRDGARQEVTVTVGESAPDRVAEAPRAGTAQPANRLGLVVGELPPAARRQLGVDYGLVVQAVRGAAADAPLRPGDVILAVNQSRFGSLAEFNRLLAAQPAGAPVALLVKRGDALLYVTLQVPEGAGG